MRIDDMNDICEFENYLFEKKKDGKKIYIFGAGQYGMFLALYFKSRNIPWDGFADNSQEKQRTKILDKDVFSPQRIEKNAYVVVAVADAHLLVDKIVGQLMGYGIANERIIEFTRNGRLLRNVIVYVKKAQPYLDKIKALKGIYCGKRCFLLGNGPSLQDVNWGKLDGELIFGCNGLYQIIDKIPQNKITGYMFSDPLFLSKNVNSVEDLQRLLGCSEYCFTLCNNDLYDKYKDSFSNLFFFSICSSRDRTWFSEEPAEGICESGTSLYALMQIIAYMGIREIYLLGVDFSFRKEIHGEKVIINEKIDNHHKDIDQVYEGPYDIDFIMQGYECAKSYAENHDIKIYNATKGSKLEIFQRVDFDSLFEKQRT